MAGAQALAMVYTLNLHTPIHNRLLTRLPTNFSMIEEDIRLYYGLGMNLHTQRWLLVDRSIGRHRPVCQGIPSSIDQSADA